MAGGVGQFVKLGRVIFLGNVKAVHRRKVNTVGVPAVVGSASAVVVDAGRFWRRCRYRAGCSGIPGQPYVPGLVPGYGTGLQGFQDAVGDDFVYGGDCACSLVSEFPE